jgi:hypothetical protein
MSAVLERIQAWQDAGLIDTGTADRLRDAESRSVDDGPAPADADPSSAGATARPARSVGVFFGPTPTIAEMFAYLGGGFFIGAYSTFLTRIAGEENRFAIMTAGSLLGTAILFGLGLPLARGDARRRRAGGVVLLVGVNAAAATMSFLTQLLGWSFGGPSSLVIAFGALLVAMAARRLLPAVTTQVAVLGGVTAVGAALMSVVRDLLSGTLSSQGVGAPLDFQPRIGDVGRDVVLPAIGWAIVAIVIGAIGLAEGRTGRPAAERRAGISRLWAGLVAVIGVATAVMTSGLTAVDTYGRLLEPWIADVVLIAVAAVLVERAIRRDAAAYVIPAALGLITALTDFNFTYLSGSTDVGLVSEGVILLAVGYAADRLRRRLGTDGENRPVDPVAVATEGSVLA